MPERVRDHLRSNVVGYIALFFALTGGAYAIQGKNTVDSGDIRKGQVKSTDVANENRKGALKGIDVAANSLTGKDLDEASLRAVPSAGNADQLDNLNSTDFLRANASAGGDLTGSYPDPLVAPNAVAGAEVADNSLRGTDIDESTLGQVPSALLGGLGRSSGGGSCDPESMTFVACALVTADLPAPARLLLIGRATAHRENTPDGGQGTCRISSSGGPLPGSTTSVFIVDADATENVSQVVVSDVLPAGQHSFNLECNEGDEDRQIQFDEAGIAAVAISPS
jgi:hypothetical protein